MTVSNGRSWMGRGRIAGADGGLAVIELDEAWLADLPRRPEVVVSLAPPKGDRLSWAVQKLAEVGVGEVWLMETERSIRFPSEPAVDRLRTVAREAAMQSSQPVVTAVGRWSSLREAASWSVSFRVLLHEGTSERLTPMLPAVPPATVHVLVGPEGGFSEGEVGVARDAGMCVASLGPSILRTETAAVAGAAIVLARYGRLG